MLKKINESKEIILNIKLIFYILICNIHKRLNTSILIRPFSFKAVANYHLLKHLLIIWMQNEHIFFFHVIYDVKIFYRWCHPYLKCF
jgi:hypothetical protein